MMPPRGPQGENLEQKLDRLLREVDELRRELRGNRRPRGNNRAQPNLDNPFGPQPRSPNKAKPDSPRTSLGPSSDPPAERR
jgi:hypothetical protein